MTKLRTHLAALIVVSALLPAGAAFSADGDPVKVTADTFQVTENSNQAVFSGNVVITQPGVTVYAQKVVVHYGKGGAQDIRSLDATGNLKIVTKDQTITGQTGVYDPKTKIMKVSGDVVVVNKTGTVKGPDLLVNFNTNTASFTTKGGGRVSGVFNP